MFHGLFVGAAFLSGKLPGAFVELRGHLGGFFRRTTKGPERGGELFDFHKQKNADEPQPIRARKGRRYLFVSAGTILMLSTP